MPKRTIGARRAILAVAIGAVISALVPAASAQVTPAAGYVPPDDTPSIKVGFTLFADYTYTDSPTAKNADGSDYNPNSFNVSRAYINVTGQLHHLFSFRITPDVVRVTDAAGTLSGSYALRLKYGFGQLNMDEWLPKGSWVRLGLQQTPYIDYAEGIYRYRFQSAIMVDRDGFLTSSDLGLSSRVSFPGNYGDAHLGIYNGEGYSKAEANDQKGFQVRASVRPLASLAVAKGWRVTGFWNSDHVAKDQKRNRWLVDTTFEHPWVNLGLTYLEATNQASPGAAEVKPRDFSIWVTPRTPFGLEALIRYDELKPNKDLDPKQKRLIAGIAWWFNFGHGIVSALMADYTREKFDDFTPAKADNKLYALHTLFNF
ncbi:MAG TPA: hypothetical protein VKS23_02650 [Thermoanaerobaculia bacterium]|nr:hypothetical protein [Thermoanaerobaculia bacterium]